MIVNKPWPFGIIHILLQCMGQEMKFKSDTQQSPIFVAFQTHVGSTCRRCQSVCSLGTPHDASTEVKCHQPRQHRGMMIALTLVPICILSPCDAPLFASQKIPKKYVSLIKSTRLALSLTSNILTLKAFLKYLL